jgi:hypothetical protein
MVNQLQVRYDFIISTLEQLPLNEDKSLEEYEREVIARHKAAVRNFKVAMSDVMIWKQEIHSTINYELQNRS